MSEFQKGIITMHRLDIQFMPSHPNANHNPNELTKAILDTIEEHGYDVKAVNHEVYAERIWDAPPWR